MGDDSTTGPEGETRAQEAPDGTTRVPSPEDAIGTTIASHRIVRLIARGGMGAVYEAEQGRPRRRVALKLIRPDLLALDLRRRFEREAEALGRLHHPGIAQVYEAGVVETARGPQPFIAMELIRGRRLDGEVAACRLSFPERLGLSLQVCDAIQHAHDSGIIHRDLKPGAILVDERGQPKIVDFGLARIDGVDLRSMEAVAGAVLGTVPYMSPEQVRGDVAGTDTRTDVYALGVIAYELLTGTLPFDLKKRALLEAARIIQEEDAPRLSSIDRAFRGDLDTVVGKALEKDRVRRYATAKELGDDIERHLGHKPIAARPTSAFYRLRKLVRRRQGMVATATGVGALLLLSIFVTGVRTKMESKAEITRARDEGKLSKALADTLLELRRSEGPEHQATLDRLDAEAQRLRNTAFSSVAAEIDARRRVSESYLSWGEAGRAEKEARTCLAGCGNTAIEGHVLASGKRNEGR